MQEMFSFRDSNQKRSKWRRVRVNSVVVSVTAGECGRAEFVSVVKENRSRSEKRDD